MTDEAAGHALARIQSRASQIREDEDFKAIIAQLKHRSIRKWSDSKDTNSRESAWYDLQAVGRLENYLKALADGKTLDDRKDAAKEKVSRR